MVLVPISEKTKDRRCDAVQIMLPAQPPTQQAQPGPGLPHTAQLMRIQAAVHLFIENELKKFIIDLHVIKVLK